MKMLGFILIFFCNAYASAQTYTKQDSINIYKLLDISDQKSPASLDSGLYYAKLALQLSKVRRMPRGEGFAMLKIADILSQQEKTEGINTYFDDANKIGASLKDSFMLALSSYQQGQNYMYEGKLDIAEKLYHRALQLKFGKEETNYTAVVYNDMGYLFGEKEELDKQIEWYLKAIRIYEKIKDPSGAATTYNNLGTTYHTLGNHEKAIGYFRNAIELREQIGDVRGLANSYENLSRTFWSGSLDSAAKYQQLSMRYAERSGVPSAMMRSYDNLSVLSDRQKNKPAALEWITKSIELCRKTGDKGGLANRSRWAALLSGDLKDTTGAEAYFQESFDASLAANSKAIWRDFYGTKTSYYSKLGDYKRAYENHRKFHLYRDSIISSETSTNIAEIQTKYETEKKDNEINRLNTQQKVKQLEIEKQKAIIAGNKLEALQKENEIKLLSQQQELRDARIKQQEEQLARQSLVAKNHEQALRLADAEKTVQEKQLQNQRQLKNAMIIGSLLLLLIAAILFNRYQLKKKLEQQAAMQDMRNHIASDLHDDIGASISNINILNELTRRNAGNAEKVNEYLQKASEDIKQVSEGISDIVWNINPRYDDLDNLFIRMKRYASDILDGKNINYTIDFPEKTHNWKLEMDKRRDLYLLFKEAINNLAKYSKAKNAFIKLEIDQNRIHLIVKDDGVGFDVQHASIGNGLQNMKQRAALLKGNFNISSRINEGTLLELDMQV